MRGFTVRLNVIATLVDFGEDELRRVVLLLHERLNPAQWTAVAIAVW